MAVVSLDRTGRPVAGAVTLATASDIAAIHGDVVLARVQLADDRSFQVIMLVIRGLSIVSREVLSITPARQLQPLLTSLGTAYIAVWMELSGATFTTKSAVLDATGSRTTTVRQLRGAPVALTSSGFDALLLSTDAGELIATQIGRDGSVLRETAIATPEWSSPPAVVWAGSHYLIGWLDRAGMSIVLLTADGIASTVRHITLDSPHAAPPGTVRAWTDAHFAFDGTHVLLAFRQVNVPPWPVFEPQDAIALAVRLDRYGTVMDAMPTVVDADDPQALSLATSGIEFVLVARNAESAVRATTISTQPTIRVDASAIIFEAPRDVGAAVSWSGRDYAVVISHQAFKSRIAVKYLARDLSPTRTATTTETPSWIRSPVIAATFGGDVIVAASEAQERATVAVTYSSDHMRPLGLPPLPPQRVQTLTDPARYQVTVTWEAPPGPITWEGFAIQIRPPVGGGYASLVEASARSATVSAATRQRITVRTFNEAGLSPAEPEIPRRRSVAF